MAGTTKLRVELLVDREVGRVVFAEAGKDFVDVLFSFLTLPLGTVIRLLSKESSVGSMDAVYESVERLGAEYLSAPACREMLLRPRNAARHRCARLAVDVEASEPEVFYRCRTWNRYSAEGCSISAYPGGRCACGQEMDTIVKVRPLEESDEGDGGAFVKGPVRFMVGDDLVVMPASMGSSLVLFDKLGITDSGALEKKVVDVGTEEILKLLKRSLTSAMPLTECFLRDPDIILDEEDSLVKNTIRTMYKHKKGNMDAKKVNLKLFISRETDKVVYAETGEDFVDLVFSFLTFPLGSIPRLLEKHSFLGSIDNLYRSVENLSNSDDYIKSDYVRMLLNPKLPPYFGCKYKLLEIDDIVPRKLTNYNGCVVQKTETDPRFTNSRCRNEGSFVKELAKFMVTDEMTVTPLSPISGVHIINKLMVPIEDLEEVEASLGHMEAINMLQACLTSRTALSDVFSSKLLVLFEDKWSGRFHSKVNLQ